MTDTPDQNDPPKTDPAQPDDADPKAARADELRRRFGAARAVSDEAAALAAPVEALTEALGRIIASLRAERGSARSRKKLECNTIGAAIMKETPMVQDSAGTVSIYNGRHWQEATDHLLKHLAKEADGEDTTRDRRNEIVDYIKSSAHKADLQWGRCADAEVPFFNGVLDVISGVMRPHRREDYLENVIPHEWMPEARCPTWLRILDEWFPRGADDDGAQRQEVIALQEFFGYVILPHARYKKALVCLGPSDSGKSVVPVVLRRMVGERFCCTLGVDKMDDPQLCAVLVGKRLNTVTEISQNAMVSDGGFKTLISTEEAILINEKYKPAYEYTPHAKHVFVTNNLPQVNDRTKAVFNRLLMVLFTIVIDEARQDPELSEKLMAEMPGIIVWSVEGARRLIEQRGKFSEPDASRDEIKRYMVEMNPFIGFAEECLLKPGKGVMLGRLTDQFNAWNRGSRKSTMRQVTKLARAAGYEIGSVRFEDGRSVKALKDCDLTIPADTDLSHGRHDGGDGPPDDGAPPPGPDDVR